jgi:hypothetical protein
MRALAALASALLTARWLDLRRRDRADHAGAAAVEERIRQALAAGPAGGTVRAHALSDRVVELTGFAPDRVHAADAVTRVRDVEGVAVVIDRIEAAP